MPFYFLTSGQSPFYIHLQDDTQTHTLPFRHALIYTTEYLQCLINAVMIIFIIIFIIISLKTDRIITKNKSIYGILEGFDDFLVVVDMISGSIKKLLV